MNGLRFDVWTRRRFGLAAGGMAVSWLGLAVGVPTLTEARKKKKVKRNAFGCVDVGKFCKNDGQCCSGICAGKKGKKQCKAHDAEGCQARQVEEFCGGIDVPCTTSAGVEDGACDTTTGNAGFCAGDGECTVCTKDADCIALCGPQAACIICNGECEETGGTACVGPAGDSCVV